MLGDAPLGSKAISEVTELQSRLPKLAREAGLRDVETGITGETAIAGSVIGAARGDAFTVSIAIIAIELLLLVLFLRAIIAPLYLLVCTCLGVAAALGITTFVFVDLLGHEGLTFYVPFAAAILLITLGADYGVFGVATIWQEARDRPLRDAVRRAVPRSTRAIVIAGVTLASSFALLALIPVWPFREMAVAIAVGLVVDVLLVRRLLIPSLVVLVGRPSGWPGRTLRAPGSRPGERRAAGSAVTEGASGERPSVSSTPR